MKTKHDFKHICYNSEDLFSNVDNLSKFMNRLDKQSVLHPERWSPEDYKGKALEALIEVLILTSPVDARIDIIDYEPVLKQDYGIDGVGKSHHGETHTVQIKYRSNVVKSLTANEDHISNFVAKSDSDYLDEMISTGKKIKMTIFTTAKDLNQKVNEGIYRDRVRVVGYKELSPTHEKSGILGKI
jgi:hypothetical protein